MNLSVTDNHDLSDAVLSPMLATNLQDAAILATPAVTVALALWSDQLPDNLLYLAAAQISAEK